MRIVPKNKTGGIVTSTVFGIGALIIATIIILVLVSTLRGANLFEDSRLTTLWVNESSVVVVNETNGGPQVGNYTLDGASCTVTSAQNASGGTIAAPNWTTTAATCRIAFVPGAASDEGLNNTVWTLNVTTTYDGEEEQAVNDASTNFTTGIDNVSSKLPTILTIVAVVFLLGALVLLVKNANQMGIGGGGSSL